ncbi:MAG: hypothetical protein MZV63_62735 [Marinilabiliales bacterium]|nr:hypothetical protein [Marinilabiliales bacterium]
MTEEIIIAGFGGQGVLSMGKIHGLFGHDAGHGGELDAIIRPGDEGRNCQRERDI